MTSVLDASALLAYLRAEPGAQTVVAALGAGASSSAVNLSEVLAKLDEVGIRADDAHRKMVSDGILGSALQVQPFTEADAIAAGQLRVPTRSAGLSTGDRACLALATRLGVPALTADRQWLKPSLGLTVTLIR